MCDDHSIENEPRFGARMPERDPSEAKADRTLAREAGDQDRHGESVHDEPAIFPGQDGKLIRRDWTCSRCGYNLRGLTTGHACPECGHIELYHPPPREAESYGQWLARRRGEVSLPRSLWAIAVASLVGGPLAILGSFMQTPQSGWLMIVVFGPTVEEVMKIAAISWLVEVRPYLLRSRGQIYFVALTSGLFFAVIENVVYLNIYISSPTLEIIVWRWVGCTALHIGCCLIASVGLVRTWRRTIDEGRSPRLSTAFRFLVAAIIVHGTYNGTVLGLELYGVQF